MSSLPVTPSLAYSPSRTKARAFYLAQDRATPTRSRGARCWWIATANTWGAWGAGDTVISGSAETMSTQATAGTMATAGITATKETATATAKPTSHTQ
jgi:hypothetical protein